MNTLGDRWGAETSPSGYDLQFANTADSIAPGIVEFATAIKTSGETLIDAIIRARNSVAMSDAQRQLLDVQVQRARAGLPPLQMETYTAPGTIAGMTPQTLMLIGAALLIVYLIARKG